MPETSERRAKTELETSKRRAKTELEGQRTARAKRERQKGGVRERTVELDSGQEQPGKTVKMLL
jgi:hypothetical protein